MADGGGGYEPSAEEVERALKWLAWAAAESRSDVARFFEFVMREEKTNARITIAPHQALILAFVMAHPKCIVRAPIGFSKTYLMIALTLFLLGVDQTQRGAIVSAAQAQSKKVVGAARYHIESNDELHLAFPELMPSRRKGDPWTQAAIVVDRGKRIIRDPSLVAVGVGGKLPGARLSWTLCDDLLTHENTASEQQRKYVLDWVISSVLTRQDAVASRFVLQNVPWVAKTSADTVGDITYELEAEPYLMPSLTLDAYGDIEIRNTDWDSDLIRPAYVGDNSEGVRHRLTAHDDPAYARYAGEEPVPGWIDRDDQVPLWPEAYPLAVLEAKRRELGSFEFVRAYRCKPRDETTSPVKTAWIEACKQKAVRANLHRTVEMVAAGMFQAVITSVDPAFSGRAKKKSNKTSIFTFGILGSGERVVLENLVGRWSSGPEIADRVISAVQRFSSLVVVEGNAAQKWMKDILLLKNRTIPVRTAITSSNKNDPRFGVQSIFVEIENGLWLFPNDGTIDFRGEVHTGKCPDGVQDFISDLLEYSPDRHTGDSLMSAWIGREYARRLGLLNVVQDDGSENGDIAALIGAR